MTPLIRRRVAVACCGALTGGLALGAAWWATTRYARDLARESAVTVSTYLGVAAPAAQGSADYDLPQFLIQARALATLLGPSRAEVFHGTAPLVDAVASPLAPAVLERLRREETTLEDGDGALAPLFDRDGWEVVGAVRIPRPRLAGPWWNWMLGVLFLITIALSGFWVRTAGAGRPDAERRALASYTCAAFLLGCAAYLEVRTVAKRATDQWLADTKALVQEAATRFPGGLGIDEVAVLARGGELVQSDNVPQRRTRRRVRGVVMGIAAVRMGSGRWAELRRPAEEAAPNGWLICVIGLTLLGPAGAGIVTSRAASTPPG